MSDIELKAALVARLRDMLERMPQVAGKLEEIDERLMLYLRDVAENSEGEGDVHNVDEVAAACKFVRMAAAYDMDVQAVRKFVQRYEKFKFSGMKGRTTYRMTPIQVFMTCGIFGPQQPTQTLPKRGVSDTTVSGGRRRVTREAIIFIPRKFAKTTYLAALAADDILSPVFNSECHVVANAESQAKIAFREAKELLMQLDPDGKLLRFTANEINFKHGASVQVGGKQVQLGGLIQAHTAGGKTKDGAYASIVLADEYGSAQYVKGHSDMADALNVYESSMGPRPNPLTVITTTAGRVIEGPFEQKLRGAQQELYKELDYEYDQMAGTDWQFMLAMHPDAWELTDECLSLPRVHRKVNPHIGITVQSDYYEQQWAKAQSDPEVMKEVKTKLFNIFVSNSARPWIQAEEIRRLQCDLRIEELDRRDWMAYVGCDFSKTDDLCSCAFLCWCPAKQIAFWDVRAWIAEKNLQGHPNSALYRQWAEEGWLKVCPGNIISDNVITDTMEEVWDHVTFTQLVYDSYDSARFMTNVLDWMRSKRRQEGWSVKVVEQYIKWAFKPISQTFGNFNAVCSQMKDNVLAPKQIVYISANPLWPWVFGNAVLQESNDGMGNVKMVKRTANGKIDPTVCIGMCYIALNNYTPFK